MSEESRADGKTRGNGLCDCGCGQETKIAMRDYNYRGVKKGDALRFVYRHQNRYGSTVGVTRLGPERLCACGCGEVPKRSKRTYGNVGIKKGEQFRFVIGHHSRLSPHEYLPEDRGFSSPCWIWQRNCQKSGYGIRTAKDDAGNRGTRMAHRQYWEKYRGPIPEGYVVDHLCGNKPCVNPDHLEPVTQAENIRRATIENLSGDVRTVISALLKHPMRRQIAEGLLAGLPASSPEQLAG